MGKIIEKTEKNKASLWHTAYNTTSFTGSLLILTVAFGEHTTQKKILFCQTLCKSCGICWSYCKPGAVWITLPRGWWMFELFQQPSGIASSKLGGKPDQFSISDPMPSLGKWMAVLHQAGHFGQRHRKLQRKVLHVWKVHK